MSEISEQTFLSVRTIIRTSVYELHRRVQEGLDIDGGHAQLPLKNQKEKEMPKRRQEAWTRDAV